MVNKWKTVELGDLVTLASGGSFPLKYQSNTNGKYSFFKVSDMNLPINQKYLIESKNTIDEEVKEKLKSKIHPKNTIVFPKVGAALLTNKRRLLVEPSAFDNNIMGIIPNENVDFEYLYYYMLTVDFRKLSQTGAIPSINNTIVSSLPVDLPINKNEQQKIATILSSVDKAIEKTNEIIKQIEIVKKGLIKNLVKYGIGQEKFKSSELGELPEHWDVVGLGDILKVSYGKNQKNVEIEKGDVPILGTGGLIGYASEPLYSKPSVLIGRKGTIDKPQFIEKPFWTIDTLFYTKINDKVAYPKFLYYVFTTINWKKYNEATGVPSLSAKNISKINIKLPPLQEQKEMATIIESISLKEQIEREKLKGLNQLRNGLMQQLLTGKVRVPLNQNEEVPQ